MAGEDLNPDPNETAGEGKPNEGTTVPLKALEAERHKRHAAETEAAELRGQVNGMATTATAKATETPKQLSATELRQLVDDGRISDDQAQEIRDRQNAEQVKSDLRVEFNATVAADKVLERVNGEIGRYKTAVPDLLDRSSPAFAKVRSEFEDLISLGHDAEDKRTELMAARAVFGSITALEAAGKPDPRETHQETGGRGEGGEGLSVKDGWPKDMPAKMRSYYDYQINQGALADRKAAIAEWSYEPKHRPSHAA